VKQNLSVTNNRGLPNRAYELGIEWIAGPFFKPPPSYALLAYQEGVLIAVAHLS